MMRLVRPLLLATVLLTAPAALAQDISAPPAYGDVRLNGGFVPDPHVIELTAGGQIAVDEPGCDYGHVAEAPDVDFYYNGSGARDLFIYAVSGSDTMLLINKPDGTWVCDDDAYGDGDPLLHFHLAPSGLYNIWVGTYGEDPAPATLLISELDPR